MDKPRIQTTPSRGKTALLTSSLPRDVLGLISSLGLGWAGLWVGVSGSSHVLSSWDHKALGENADAAITVTLQPCLVHCMQGESGFLRAHQARSAHRSPSCPSSPLTFTQDVHDVPPLQGQVLGPPGRVAVLGHHLAEGRSATCSLRREGGLQGWRRAPGSPVPHTETHTHAILRLTWHWSCRTPGLAAASRQALCSASSPERGTQRPLLLGSR